MERLIRAIALLLPLVLAGAGVATLLTARVTEPTQIAVAGLSALALGTLLYLLLHSFAVLVGHAVQPPPPADERIRQLEREKQVVLRSIKEIEFDADLQRLDAKQAAQLVGPLRQRAIRVLRELDEARVGSEISVDEAIEAELQRRSGQQPDSGVDHRDPTDTNYEVSRASSTT